MSNQVLILMTTYRFFFKILNSLLKNVGFFFFGEGGFSCFVGAFSINLVFSFNYQALGKIWSFILEC